MKELEYPFDSNYILSKKKSIKKNLLNSNLNFVEKNIAILGGSTTSEIKNILELFLLNNGIKPNFYESEYNMYYEDAVFPNEELEKFQPDIIYIHTTNRNIQQFPTIKDESGFIDEMLENEYQRYVSVWQSLKSKYNAIIIQNNFEWPYYRLLGNQDASNIGGRVNYITRLNMRFYEYAQSNDNFYINDINYISSTYGLDEWGNQFYWHMYKYALCLPAIPTLSFNIANIIKSIYGKNKKGFVLDLDNTLWGGIVGDDGVENLAIGPEVPSGQVFSEFQSYLKSYKDLGIILNVSSKNEEENAIAGLKHEDGPLSPEDFIVIKANWNPKSQNIIDIANELNLGVDSLVFVDDNPAEREIVKQEIPTIAVPEVDTPENYIKIVDRSGFFETTIISKDDAKKNDMYKENAKRNQMVGTFEKYEDYLLSLEMKADIKTFASIYYARIAQLSNKSNQFNLTTRRYAQTEIEDIATNENYIKLYGSLADKFGDNGVVSVVIGEIKQNELHIDLWIMSCRVLKRDMEFAMMDTLVKRSKEKGIKKIIGYYYPTVKNKMVKDFYQIQGLEKVKEEADGSTVWEMDITEYEMKNKVINVEEK